MAKTRVNGFVPFSYLSLFHSSFLSFSLSPWCQAIVIVRCGHPGESSSSPSPCVCMVLLVFIFSFFFKIAVCPSRGAAPLRFFPPDVWFSRFLFFLLGSRTGKQGVIPLSPPIAFVKGVDWSPNPPFENYGRPPFPSTYGLRGSTTFGLPCDS